MDSGNLFRPIYHVLAADLRNFIARTASVLTTPIIQLVDRDPISLDVGKPVSDAAGILASGRFHHLPIVEGENLVGMISAADILKVNAALLDEDDSVTSAYIDARYSLRDVMTEDPITISDRGTVADAAKTLSAGGFHSLPIVNRENHLVGVVTTTDLINHILEAPATVSSSPETQPRLQALERVYTAAQHYLHSGLAESEHTRLERALEMAREVD